MTAGDDPVAALFADYVPAHSAERADVAEILRLLAAGPDPWSQRLPLHLTASALVVHPQTGRVLLRWHARQRSWLQVGGHGDPGERDPLEIALREAREETGLTDLVPWPGAGLLHAVLCAVPAKGASPAHVHGDLRFTLTTASPDTARPERPDAALRWLTLPDAEEATSEDNLRESIRRLRALLTQEAST